MTEVSSTTQRSPQVKNPAPHRGFNSKAREVLIEPTSKLFANSIRHSSELEINPAKNQQGKLERTDSQQTNGSSKSQSSTHSYPAMTEEFDSLEDLPRRSGGKVKKMLGDIGKTRSAGDLLKNSKKPTPLIRTFQQLNIMKLPSVDSVTGDNNNSSKSLTRLNTMDPLFDDGSAARQKVYEMK